MIYCIWYPSGGFGHFINSVLTLHGKKFKRPTNNIKFGKNGNSHSLHLVAPKYQTTGYNYKFDPDYHYSVLVDLGITSTSRDFMAEFSDAKFIKVCYTDVSWPVVARTMIDKAMESSIEEQLPTDIWETGEPWAQREKYFLFLRDHSLRTAWHPESGLDCILVESLMNYDVMKHTIEQTSIELSEFSQLWNKWNFYNKKYFLPVIMANLVVDKIKKQESFDLTPIKDVWTQAVIYYFIWNEFGKEVPHNNFKNFVHNVDQITQWLNQ